MDKAKRYIKPWERLSLATKHGQAWARESIVGTGRNRPSRRRLDGARQTLNLYVGPEGLRRHSGESEIQLESLIGVRTRENDRGLLEEATVTARIIAMRR